MGGRRARAASSWLAHRCGLPKEAAQRRVRLGRALRAMPVVEAAWLAGELNEAHVVAFAAARTVERWLGEGWVEQVVFDGPDRIKNVGVRRRIFSGATRRAIELRDRTCFHPTCDAPAEVCEIDHVEPWAEGGLTTEENGRVACRFHNRERQRARPPP